jgi:hypothetical protein
VLFIKTDESIPTIVDPQVSSACVVQYDEDNVWYHGQILKYCDPLGATVLFVDYGNTQLVPVKQIKSIEQNFRKQPPLAYQCTLDGVDASRDWTEEEKKKFEGRTMAKLLSAIFTIRDSRGKYPVRLVEETKEANIAIRNSERQISPTSHHPVPGIQVAVFLINQSVSSLVGSPSLV